MISRLFITSSFVALLFCSVYPQIVIEQDTAEVEVNVTNMQTLEKSKSKAILFSAILPGLGEKYLKKPKRASIHFLGEAIIWSGLLTCNSYYKSVYGNAKSYAYLHADTKAGIKDKDYKYFEDIADFYDIWEYNRVYKTNRDTTVLYPENSDWTWHWDSKDNYAIYDNMMRKYRSWKMFSGFMVGGLVMHRFISIIDAMQLAKKYGVAEQIGFYSDGRQMILSLRF